MIEMEYLYSISTVLSYTFLALFLIRILINRKNIDFENNKLEWQVIGSLIILSIVPMMNTFLTLSSIYISILMKHDDFIKLMNREL
jgi:Na+-driven multidrug efflux pump